MREATLNLPKKLIVTNVAQFISDLYAAPEADVYVFDFRATNWADPFGMLYLAKHIKKYRQLHPEKRFVAKSYKHLTYPAHMGFFKSFGLAFGKEAGEAAGSSTYLPITALDVEDVRRRAILSGKHEVEEIESLSHGLAQILTQQEAGQLVDTLRFSFREMIRNVFEHSESSELGYCAQLAGDKVEICIIDMGIGIRTSLRRNPFLKIADDLDAMRYAIKPGISGRMFRGVKKDPFDRYENSGFGLYLAQQICSMYGSFLICSGEAGLIWKQNSERVLPIHMDGTAVKLCLNIKELPPANQLIASLIAEGEKTASELSHGEIISASKSSNIIKL